MAWNRSTTRNLSAAMKLGATECPEDCTVLAAYDKVSRSWFASYVNQQLQQVGLNGRGSDPIAAVEDLILNKKAEEERLKDPKFRMSPDWLR